MKTLQRILITLIALTLLTSPAIAQSVSRMKQMHFMALGDNAKNTQYRFNTYLSDSTLTNKTGIVYADVWLDDISFVSTNTDIQRVGFLTGIEFTGEHTDKQGMAFLNLGVGYGTNKEALMRMSGGITPNWNTKTPWGLNMTYQRLPALTFGPDLVANEVFVNGEIYFYNRTMFAASLSHGDLSDMNYRNTASLTIRDYDPKGWFIGSLFYWRSYEHDKGNEYWSPEKYSLLELQTGYKFPWNDENWQGDLTVGVGMNNINGDREPMARTYIDVQRSVDKKSKLFIRGFGGYSTGKSFVYNTDGYRWWYGGLGFVIR